MGTNYYYLEPQESDLLADNLMVFKKIHLGKSSGGWKFLFYYVGYPGIEPLDVFLCDKIIIDEYDRAVNFIEFLKLIKRKQKDKSNMGEEGFGVFKVGEYEFLDSEFS